ncbi:MAG: hypothetical protein LUH36_06880 [Oscillospiraceae bacterium]|nr:hypothetical protein [Oscillospiraceae bacterium]
MLHTLKTKINAKTILMLIPSAVFLVFIFYMLARNMTGAAKETIKDTEISFYGFSQLSGEFEDTLQEDFYQKNDFINLNGLTTRVLGINTLNERQKLANGYLTTFSNARDTTESAENVIALNNFLKEQGIEFLYVLAPNKYSFYGAEFAPGYSSTGYQIIDTMISALEDAGVNNIDMDAWFKENDWSMEDVFFKTDHHWLPQAAFAAANEILQYMEENFSIEYDNSMADYDGWEITIYEDFFLGSCGKRVGTMYTGLDDVWLIYRADQGPVEFSYLPSGTTTWRYQDSSLQLSLLTDEDYFNSFPYGVYIGGDYPLVNIKNDTALNDLKILIIGDSYRRPVEQFLSYYFTELYHIDLRYYTDGTFAEYVEEIQPDIVVMCLSSDDVCNVSLNDFGTAEYEAALAQTQAEGLSVTDLSDAAIAASDNANSFTVLCTGLTPGQTYTLTVDGTAYSGGEDLYVQATLQDLSTNKAIYNRYFDANSDETQTWIFTVPEGSDTYAIYFYAGTKGSTANVSASLEGVRLYTGIYEQP